MDPIRVSIERPTAVVAIVLMAVLLGGLALFTIPIQLSPDLRKPLITVTTTWPGAAPMEIEREIVLPQEEALKGLKNLERMVVNIREGRAFFRLEFGIGQDMDRAMLLVSNRLDRVSGYPDEVDEPEIGTRGPEDDRIAWFYLWRAPGNEQPMHSYGNFAEDVIKERMERVPGVASSEAYGGGKREMRIIVDPAKMARYRITVPLFLEQLRRANVSGTAGDVEEGKRRYVVRADGELDSLQRVRSVVLRAQADAQRGGIGRVTVGDIALVEFGYADPVSRIRNNGRPAFAINATREAGANVIEVMKGVREAVAELNAGPVGEAGLVLELLYDETVYIQSAIDLVLRSIWLGGALAIGVLLLFLRSGRATLVVALAIPVSVVASFVAMAFLGRSLNVVSLAGIAFAVGMVVDAAIIVLENIYRLREQGHPAPIAAYRGARQVWSAILVSTLTTVVVFIPLLLMELEVGQLFRDIAVAISVAVLLSLLVAVTVIPALANRLLRGTVTPQGQRTRLPLVDGLASGFVAAVLHLVRLVVRIKSAALVAIGGLMLGAGALTWLLWPPLEYLPEGNRNLVIGYVSPPPGYNLATTTAMAERIEAEVRPYWAKGVDDIAPDDEPPRMRYFTFIASRQRTVLVARGTDPDRAYELRALLQKPAEQFPGTSARTRQPPIFEGGVGGTRSVQIHIGGPDIGGLIELGKQVSDRADAIMSARGGADIWTNPSLELGVPEVRVVPDPDRLAEADISVRDLLLSIDAFNDSVRVAEISVGGQQMDLMLTGQAARDDRIQQIGALPIVLPSGTILPVRSLAKVEVTAGPSQIRRLERVRVVTVFVKPPKAMALGEAIDLLRREIIAPMRARGLPPGVSLRMAGTAEKLDETAREMRYDLLLALAIVFLVMAILFESFVYPLIIVLAVPLAMAGGMIGLEILNLFAVQKLDMLTMLGFVILLGIVVNNAILLVHQTLYLVRQEGMAADDAIVEATRNRIRPIFMSTLTSVFGMLPLVLFPGAGSEIYRGLGSVVLGGLALSAVLTLAFVPPLMSVLVEPLERRRARRRAKAHPLGTPEAAE